MNSNVSNVNKEETTEAFLGYRVFSSGVFNCIAQIENEWDSMARARLVACINPHSYVCAKKDSDFRNALLHSDYLLPDGIGIIFGARVLGSGIRERVTGPDFFDSLSAHLSKHRPGTRVFFLGSKDATLRRLRLLCKKRYPGVTVCGVYSPPFVAEFSEAQFLEIMSKIRDVNPQVLWVGLTAPKQEKLCRLIIPHLPSLKICGAIGAAFDWNAGITRRANRFWQRSGMEWLIRFCREPSRLWRRVMVTAPAFILSVVIAKLKGRARGA